MRSLTGFSGLKHRVDERPKHRLEERFLSTKPGLNCGITWSNESGLTYWLFSTHGTRTSFGNELRSPVVRNQGVIFYGV